MKTHRGVASPFILACCLLQAASGQDNKMDPTQSCPMHQQHAAEQSHQAVVHERGDDAMGFSHQATTHHFLLASMGGTIEATANSAEDNATVQAIRAHLSNIARLFANGDFSAPAFAHAGIPPGVTTMRLLKARISYRFAEIPSGGRVELASKDPVAVAAIHDFLRFQIVQHETGDTLAGEALH